MQEGGLRNRVNLVGASAPGAATNILSTSISPSYVSAFRIDVSLASGSIFYYTVTSGSTTKTVALNTGTALTAQAGYTFTIACHPDNSYNFQVGTNVAIDKLQVDEVSTGVI